MHLMSPSDSKFATPSSRWAALQSRNPAAENSFIYSVITTKIYCRPTCPSRLARRANIVFHDSAADAERDGFRPCRRCRPDLKSEEVPQRKAIEKACQLIRGEEKQGNETKKWTVKALAKEVGLTESHFCRSFKRVMGCTIGEYRTKIISAVNEERGIGIEDNASYDATIAESSEPLVAASEDVTASEPWDPPFDATAFDHGTFIWNNHDEWNQDVNMNDWISTDTGTANYYSHPGSLALEDAPTFDGEPDISQPD
ncbi:hypothetical protein B7463_g9647, partial [Scytalidium lignicola]